VWEERSSLLGSGRQFIGMGVDRQARRKRINLITTLFRAVPLLHYVYSVGRSPPDPRRTNKVLSRWYVASHRELQARRKVREKEAQGQVDTNLFLDVVRVPRA